MVKYRSIRLSRLSFNVFFYSTEPSVPVAALGAVNEILYKNCVPAEFESFFVILFNNCCVILHRLINRLNDERLPQPSQPQ